MNQGIIFLLIPLFLILLPFACLVHIIAPCSKFGKFISQPCIKYFSHILTYIIFIGMIIGSSLKFREEQQNCERFSLKFPQFNHTFYLYTLNKFLKHHFPVNDFYIRMQSPSNLDYCINLWVAGNLNNSLVYMYFNFFIRIYMA